MNKEVNQAARNVNSSSATTTLDLSNKQAPHHSFSQMETIASPSFALSNPITNSFAITKPTPQQPAPQQPAPQQPPTTECMPVVKMQSTHTQSTIPSKGIASNSNANRSHLAKSDGVKLQRQESIDAQEQCGKTVDKRKKFWEQHNNKFGSKRRASIALRDFSLQENTDSVVSSMPRSSSQVSLSSSQKNSNLKHKCWQAPQGGLKSAKATDDKKDKWKSTAARKSLDRARKTLSTKNTTIEKEVKQAARYVNSSSSTTKLDLCNKQAPHNSFSQTETLIPPSFAFSNPITSSFALINPTPQPKTITTITNA
jgi:hypothetical protein